MQVRLAEVNSGNWREAIKLEVHPEQASFVASNLFSLAEAYARPEGRECRPMAIYHEDKMVGFAMHVFEPWNESIHWVGRFMIDRCHQGQGFGRAGMIELIKLIKENERCEAINLTVHPDNCAAQALYKSLGFEDTGKVEDAELVYSLPLLKMAHSSS